MSDVDGVTASVFLQKARNNKYDVSKYAASTKIDIAKLEAVVNDGVTNYPAYIKEEIVIIQPIRYYSTHFKI